MLLHKKITCCFFYHSINTTGEGKREVINYVLILQSLHIISIDYNKLNIYNVNSYLLVIANHFEEAIRDYLKINLPLISTT